MKAVDALHKWLSNPRRRYAEGLILFEALAADSMRVKYLEYFKKANQHPAQFDTEMSMLTNKLAAIQQMVRINPDLYADIGVVSVNEKAELIPESALPAEVQKLHARNKEITPLLASLHAEISQEGIPEAKRKKLIKQLCELDDERRSNWDIIDEWSVGKVELVKVENPVYHTDPLIAGLQIARRIEQLNENIFNAEKTVLTTGKASIRQNAVKRLNEYQRELEELKNKVRESGNSNDNAE